MDNFGHNLVDQIFFEQSVSCLVVEIADKNTDEFLLHVEAKKVELRNNPESAPSVTTTLPISAKCSSCQEFGKLEFNCQCSKVNYCSKECQATDLRFHEEKCQGIEVIEKWDQSCKPN